MTKIKRWKIADCVTGYVYKYVWTYQDAQDELARMRDKADILFKLMLKAAVILPIQVKYFEVKKTGVRIEIR